MTWLLWCWRSPAWIGHHGVCEAPSAPLAQRLLELPSLRNIEPNWRKWTSGAPQTNKVRVRDSSRRQNSCRCLVGNGKDISRLSKFQEVIGKIILAGDCTKANPFNFRLDPAALDLVLNSGVGGLGLSHRGWSSVLKFWNHLKSMELSLTNSMLLKILELHPLARSSKKLSIWWVANELWAQSRIVFL